MGGLVVWAPEDTPNVVFTTRLGGTSSAPYDSLNLGYRTGDSAERVEENRRVVSEALGIPDRWLCVNQVHGNRVVHGNAITADPRLAQEADAIIGEAGDPPLAVVAADCLPIAMTAPSLRAAVHAGWRGLCTGIIDSTLSASQVDPGKIRASIGPSIGPCHYPVGDEVVRAFRNRYPKAPDFSELSDGVTHFDLRSAARWVLERRGVSVSPEDPPCTFCDPTFFSHRRDGETGRQAAILW